MVAFLVRGLLRGTIAQVFAFFGVVAGVFAGGAVADWIATHWQGARPTLVFGALRWLVAVLAGLGVAALLGWWGELLAKAAHAGPLGWLDRAVGAVVGLILGSIVCIAVLVFLLRAPGLGFARPLVARSATSTPLVDAGVRASEWGRSLPGGLWLHEQLVRASQQLAVRGQA